MKFKPEIIIQENSETGIRAITYGLADVHILIRKGNHTLQMAHSSQIEAIMYQYGSSKIMHWNTNCTKSNAKKIPIQIRLLDGLLKGQTQCRNCWDRTRCIPN